MRSPKKLLSKISSLIKRVTHKESSLSSFSSFVPWTISYDYGISYLDYFFFIRSNQIHIRSKDGTWVDEFLLTS